MPTFASAASPMTRAAVCRYGMANAQLCARHHGYGMHFWILRRSRKGKLACSVFDFVRLVRNNQYITKLVHWSLLPRVWVVFVVVVVMFTSRSIPPFGYLLLLVTTQEEGYSPLHTHTSIHAHVHWYLAACGSCFLIFIYCGDSPLIELQIISRYNQLLRRHRNNIK